MLRRLVLIYFLCILGALGNGALAQAQLVEGIQSYQVFPRSGPLEGSISVLAKGPGTLTAEVIRGGDNLNVATKKWTLANPSEVVTIDRVPLGGEYTVRFSSGGNSQVFEHILVGEIWVVGGGANAYGAEGVADPPIPQVHLFRNNWQEGKDPVFNPGYMPVAPDKTMVTAWLRAAQNYYQRTGIPVGLLGISAPGKSIEFFMDPNYVELPAFKSLVERHGKGASVFCWYHGEDDRELELARLYKDRLKVMAAAMRRYAGNPKMKMAIIQLSHQLPPNNPPVTGLGDIREQQRRFCLEDPAAILVPAISYDHRDALHLNADALRKLGSRVAQALEETKNNGDRPVWQGPKVASARLVGTTKRRVEVKFENASRLTLVTDPDEVGDPQEKWKMQWLVTDAKHQGYPRAWKPEIKNGVFSARLSGGTFGQAQADAQGNVLQVRLENFGFIMPMVVDLDGVTINLDLAEPALPGAKLHFAYLDNSKGYLIDERGKPVAAFSEIPIANQ